MRLETDLVTCPDCRRGQTYFYSPGNLKEHTAASETAWKTLVHEPACPRARHNKTARQPQAAQANLF